MPRNAHAQSLYVSHIPALSEYNAITGELIDANFITEVDPFALVVDESEQYLFVGRYPSSVGKYEPTTGRPININFITGLNRPSAFALLADKLFVADETRGTVDVYDTSTGKVINPYRFAVLGQTVAIAVKGSTQFFPEPSLFVADSSPVGLVKYKRFDVEPGFS